MMKPTKAQAIERIQRALDAIPTLMSMLRFSPEFTKWRRSTTLAIESAFGENSRNIERFNGVRYRQARTILDPTPSEHEVQEAYERGLRGARTILESMVDEIEEYWQDDVQTQSETGQHDVGEPITTNRVFVVHGRDEAAKQMVARYLEGLGLDPLILQEQASQGRTIIEKFEEYAETVGFAVILGTPDDVGALAYDRANLRPRMRQNVVFELGYFTRALGRKRVCVLLKGDVERPSDYDGVIYTTLDDFGGWQMELAKEMKAAGLPVDLNRLLSA
ncbi:MAG: nucleotide-binding protein [Chloroflexota bacterium]|nr:nucleotide-binding protein [Chloroflexota bacterium]MDE2960474.1 nucleotide-binding protein [Chloroflexota bacterium]